jgi:phosphonate transport system permease protein
VSLVVQDPPRTTPGAPEQARRITTATVLTRRLVATLLVVVPVLWALHRAFPSDREVVNPGGLPLLGRLLGAVTDPATSRDFLAVVAEATVTTLVFATLGTAGALAIGSLGALVLSDAVWRHEPAPWLRSVRVVLRAVLVGIRSVHELVWALLLITVLGLDPLVAVLAIALPFGAQTAKVFAEILDNTARSPLSALRASGARSAPALAYGLLPGAAPLLLSYAFYRFECAIRSVVVLGVVGVGGLGQELVLSLRSRNWDEVWTLIAAVVVLSALVDLWSSRLRGDLALTTCSDWSAGTAPGGSSGRARSARARWTVLVAVVGVLAAWVASGVGWSGLLSPRTRERTRSLVDEMLPPALPPGGWSEVLGATLDTLSMAILAMVVAVVVTLVLGPLATRVRATGGTGAQTRPALAARRLARVASRAVLLVLRSVPPTIWAVIALLVLFPGVLPGALALGAYTGGILGRLVAEGWESIDTRPRDALRAAGMRPGLAATVAVLPASTHQLVTYTLYRFEICVRDTAVVGVVGAAGLGRLLTENLAVFRMPVVTTVLVLSFALSVGSEVLGHRLRRALAP